MSDWELRPKQIPFDKIMRTRVPNPANLVLYVEHPDAWFSVEVPRDLLPQIEADWITLQAKAIEAYPEIANHMSAQAIASAADRTERWLTAITTYIVGSRAAAAYKHNLDGVDGLEIVLDITSDGTYAAQTSLWLKQRKQTGNEIEVVSWATWPEDEEGVRGRNPRPITWH